MKARRIRSLSGFRRQVENHKKAIARERDALRDLIADANEIETDATEAIDQLEDAIDSLSRNL